MNKDLKLCSYIVQSQIDELFIELCEISVEAENFNDEVSKTRHSILQLQAVQCKITSIIEDREEVAMQEMISRNK
jgi:hypothetical protein